MTSPGVDRRLAAILSADVVGYSRLMGRDEVATVRMLTAYREQIEVLIREHRGRLVDSPGDNLLAEFPSATDALTCAGEIQRVIQARNAPLPADRRMEFRVGVHLGEVLVEGERIYGDGVNIAARLESLAEPGGICISGTVHDQVERKVSLRYEDLGDREVKNIERPVHVYRARWEEAAAPAPAPEPALRTRPVLPWAILFAVFAAVGLGVYALRSGDSARVSEGPSIAVLPFDNMSGDADQEYFSDGLTEDLITDLARVDGLTVIARNSVFTYKGKAVRVDEVGRELGVTHVLEGSVRKAGDRVRITAQLIDARDGTHVWADRYDRSLDDIFALQDEVARNIVAALSTRLAGAAEVVAAAAPPTRNLEAYDLYLRALALSQTLAPEDNAEGRRLAERAIELDPAFGPAYGILAMIEMTAFYTAWRPADALDRARELSERALALAPNDIRSRIAAANVSRAVDRWDEAERIARRTVELAPGDARARVGLGLALAHAGRSADALREMQLAYRLNPRDAVSAFYLSVRLFDAREYDRTLQLLERAIEIRPDFIALHGIRAVTLVELGRMDEARAEIAEVLRISPGFSVKGLERSLDVAEPALTARIVAGMRRAGLPETSAAEPL